MRYGETERQMVERHIREGKVTLARQRAVMERLHVLRLPLENAEALLALFERVQASHVAHLARIQKSN